MKIKMNTLYAGPSGVMDSGLVYDVDAALAHQLVDGHYAVLVEVVKETVEAVKEIAVEIETADLPKEVIETAVPSAKPVKKRVPNNARSV